MQHEVRWEQKDPTPEWYETSYLKEIPKVKRKKLRLIRHFLTYGFGNVLLIFSRFEMIWNINDVP